MRRELGIARCGLACCLCSENEKCNGCNSGDCSGKSWCENRSCSIEKGLSGCYDCEENCQKGIQQKAKPTGFRLFIKRYGMERLLDCLARNEQQGVVYHRQGITGDYDDFPDAESLIAFILNGTR
jgi:hypothetical protein